MTNAKQARPPASVRQLHQVIDQLAATVSPQRLGQLRMVAGLYQRALESSLLPPTAARHARYLFTGPTLRSLFELAAVGELRSRPEDHGKPLALASLRTVRDCLGILAAEVVPGREVWLPTVRQQAPRETVTPGQEAALLRHLVWMAASGGRAAGAGAASQYRVRMLAIAAVALDTRCRTGELAAMRLDHLGAGDRSVRVWRHPQNAAHLEPVELVLPLSSVTAEALGRWRDVRQVLVAELGGGRMPALWVSLVATRYGPPGMALGVQSIRRAYLRGVMELNFVNAGLPGWSPLPLKLESLRRAGEEESQARAAASGRRVLV